MRKKNGKKKIGRRKIGRTKSKYAGAYPLFCFFFNLVLVTLFSAGGRFRFITFRIMTN